MNRDNFQKLAQERLEDAKTLLDAGRYAGSYYLSGYVIECGLKACIAKRTKQYDFPPKSSQKIYTHNLDNLIELSELKIKLQEDFKDSAADGNLEDNWSIVKDWSEEKRYSQDIVDKDAQDLFDAVSNSENGIFQWIKRHW